MRLIVPPANLIPSSEAILAPLGDTSAAHRLVDLLIEATRKSEAA